ncbi:hypothetical protein [Nonomuraea sp. NPDC049028]|uniref:hypothetical protein n=1 Tax=Nonomuraea sp. NPDC049028 TaxID=3364348 RepID=UPI003715022D
MRRPDRLAANPLLRTRLLAETGTGEDTDRLRRLLTSAIDALADDPHTTELHRALATAYLHAAPTKGPAPNRCLQAVLRDPRRALQLSRSAVSSGGMVTVPHDRSSCPEGPCVQQSCAPRCMSTGYAGWIFRWILRR